MSEKTECIEARSLSEIKLTNEQFAQFIMVVCDNSRKPSEAILSAAKRLDEEGF
ncbi:hypothetical protein MT391_19110 [Vibrio sp. 1-Bac 57]